jgi:acetylornithine deacetylase/succinyl-diaminopimelate desuccinylase-like protein
VLYRREAIGVPQLTTPPSKFDLLNARWCSPTLSIVDIRTTASSQGKPIINPAAAAAAAAAATAASSSNGTKTPPNLSPMGLRPYAHSPAAAGQGGSGSGNYSSSVAAALNLGLPLPLQQQQQQQQQLTSVPLQLGGCVHSHHCSENSALWPTVTQVLAGGSGPSHLGGAAGFGTAADDKSCYRFGPTRFSVIPKVAVGKLSLRFVPEQEHSTLIECLQVHLEKKFEQLWSANRMELQVGEMAMFLHWSGAACSPALTVAW